MKSKYAVVVIGYNRLYSLERLCVSLNGANYLGDNVDLIISLDFCENNALYMFSESFQWNFGEKRVIFHEKKMGLKKHILSCGIFLEEYEALAILEDDIFVSPEFYSYMIQAIKFYEKDDNIAGISLYSFERNFYNGLGFKPAQSSYDTFFMQMAQSWGQIWLKRQWKEFYDWYLENRERNIFTDLHVPMAIKKWGDSSWLKYHTAYCVLKNKFFVYPYNALTTCFMETGVHAKYSDTTGQVPLYSGQKRNYNFASFDEQAVKYDVFYERMEMEKYIFGLAENKPVCMDLYGDKYQYDGYTYLLTTKEFKHSSRLGSYALQLKPQELNVIFEVEGEDIYLYNIEDIIERIAVKKNKWKRIEYFSAPKVTSDFQMMLMYFRKLWRRHLSKK